MCRPNTFVLKEPQNSAEWQRWGAGILWAGWRGGRGVASPSGGSRLCPWLHRGPHPSRLPPHLQRGFHMPTLASASPCAGWDSLDKQRTSGKIGKCESSVITTSRGGRFTQTFISISISSLSHHLLFFDLPPARNSTLFQGSPGPSPALPKPL